MNHDIRCTLDEARNTTVTTIKTISRTITVRRHNPTGDVMLTVDGLGSASIPPPVAKTLAAALLGELEPEPRFAAGDIVRLVPGGSRTYGAKDGALARVAPEGKYKLASENNIAVEWLDARAGTQAHGDYPRVDFVKVDTEAPNANNDTTLDEDDLYLVARRALEVAA